jgi:inosose dehydratase
MRIALNPIQWMASDDGWLDPSKAPERGKLLALVKEAGFDGVMAEVPAGWSVEQYQDTVGSLGLALAPGYVVCRSDGLDGGEAAVLENVAEVARQHAALGLSYIGLGMGMRKDAPRERHPAQGREADDARLAALTTLIGRITEVMLAEGVRPALHPHVATWIETEAEGRAVLDALPELGFLPDTGHLAWAGVDVRALIADHAERVPFVHLKDCRLSVARKGRAEDWNYRQTVLAGLWAEPGRGELPLTEILGALPATFDGWLMVEVDRPDIADPFESAQVSAQWTHATYG